jgi:mono/diheme cytochrome c family protein
MTFLRPRSPRTLLSIAAIGFGAVIGFAAAAGAPDGKALFEAKCALCHGVDGTPKAVTKNSGNFGDPAWQAARTDEDIRKVMREGRTGTMLASFEGRLDDAQMRAIVAHIRTLAKKP